MVGRKYTCCYCLKPFYGNVNPEVSITCGRCVAIKTMKYSNAQAKEALEVTESKPDIKKVPKKRTSNLKVCSCGKEFKARTKKEGQCLACRRVIKAT